MSNLKEHSFQEWMNENGYTDVRFYPSNPSKFTTIDMLDGAYAAVVAHDKGQSVPFEDAVETFITEKH